MSAPHLAQLRHAYAQLAAGTVVDQKQFADGLIAPAIQRLEATLTGWHAIASAPKDGTKVDLFVPGRGRLTDFHYRTTGLSGWAREEGYPVVTRVLLEKPTHWMPTPSDPEAAE